MVECLKLTIEIQLKSIDQLHRNVFLTC